MALSNTAPATLIWKIDVLLKQSTFKNGFCRNSLFSGMRKGGYCNVEDDCIIGTQFPLGWRGNVESVNYSLLCLEKSNISFNQDHTTKLLFTEYQGPAGVFVLPAASPHSLLTDWVVTFTSINLIQFSPIQ